MRLRLCQELRRDWYEVLRWPAPVYDDCVQMLAEQAEERERILNRPRGR